MGKIKELVFNLKFHEKVPYPAQEGDAWKDPDSGVVWVYRNKDWDILPSQMSFDDIWDNGLPQAPKQKAVCTCGAAATYGEDCGQEYHSSWCDKLKEEENNLMKGILDNVPIYC